MFFLNKVMLIGRLGRDPELRYTQSGSPVANFPIATDESYTDRNGKKVEKVEWHRVVVWGKQGEVAGNYLKKGSHVYIEGSLQTRKWTNKDGRDQYMTEVKAFKLQFLNPKSWSEGRQQSEPESAGPRFPTKADGLDDVPF